MDIEEILAKEPRLKSVFDESVAIKHLSFATKQKIWHRELKPIMVELVGDWCKNQELQTSEIYDKVYFHCMDLMGIRYDYGYA